MCDTTKRHIAMAIKRVEKYFSLYIQTLTIKVIIFDLNIFHTITQWFNVTFVVHAHILGGFICHGRIHKEWRHIL